MLAIRNLAGGIRPLEIPVCQNSQRIILEVPAHDLLTKHGIGLVSRMQGETGWACYNPRTKQIRIGSRCPKNWRTYAFIHELCHAVDHRVNYPKDRWLEWRASVSWECVAAHALLEIDNEFKFPLFAKEHVKRYAKDHDWYEGDRYEQQGKKVAEYIIPHLKNVKTVTL